VSIYVCETYIPSFLPLINLFPPCPFISGPLYNFLAIFVNIDSQCKVSYYITNDTKNMVGGIVVSEISTWQTNKLPSLIDRCCIILFFDVYDPSVYKGFVVYMMRWHFVIVLYVFSIELLWNGTKNSYLW
jgi:hypothetical protein